jgi:energy-converting hydrogenase B subunit D
LSEAVQIAALIMVGAGGTAVVLVRDPLRQAVVLSFYGLLLGVLFFAFQAPDVGLSQITVGSVGVPLMLLLTIAKVRKREREREEE